MDIKTDAECVPGGSDGKESACNAGDSGSNPGLGRSPEEGNGNPLPYSCLENPHGQRSLVGCSPWGHKKLDMTERLNPTPCLCVYGIPGGSICVFCVCETAYSLKCVCSLKTNI